MTNDAQPQPQPQPLDVDSYLEQLPADRRAAISAVRDAINATLSKGFEERIQYGMITWIVPESVLPAEKVYNKQPLAIASLGSQKNHMAVYLMGVYGDPTEREWFEAAYKKSGKRLDMGKSCVRFASLDKLAVDVVAQAMSRVSVESFVASYHALQEAKANPGAAAAAAAAKAAAGKPGARPAQAPVKPGAKPALAPAKPVAKNGAVAKPAAKNGGVAKSAAAVKPAAKTAAKPPATKAAHHLAAKRAASAKRR